MCFAPSCAAYSVAHVKLRFQVFMSTYVLAGPEPDTVDYCIDEADDEWLKKTGSSMGISVDRFETAIDRLEKSTGFKVSA